MNVQIINGDDAFKSMLAARDMRVPTLIFMCDKAGDGMTYSAMLFPAMSKQGVLINMPYQTIDGLLYSLADIKQHLELARTRNG